MIGGNLTATLQKKSDNGKNAIGERITDWIPVVDLVGFLDLQTGDSPITYNAKIQDSTHVFVCDYINLQSVKKNITRLKIGGEFYDVTLIDDPMELHQHLEIYLKYIGGGLNG